MVNPRASVRWIDLTAEQKKQVLRIRNTESARRSRERKRQQRDQIERAYEENEKKIDELESLVQSLSAELQSGSNSRNGRLPSSTTSASKYGSACSSASTVNDHHPDWFGEPF